MGGFIVDLILSGATDSESTAAGKILLGLLAFGLGLLALTLWNRPAGYSRRSARELFVILTLSTPDGPETFTWKVQARPYETQEELLLQLRRKLPAQVRTAPVLFQSMTPNLVGPSVRTLRTTATSTISAAGAGSSSVPTA